MLNTKKKGSKQHYMGAAKKLAALVVVVGAVAVLIVAIPPLVSAAPGGSIQTASATLRTLNNSGGSGHATFIDDGSGISVNGTAEGLTPGVFHFSLFYDINSVATGPFGCEPGFDGPAGLAPMFHPGALSLAEMGLVGGPVLVWDVSDKGKGRLRGTVPGVHLDRVRTISIRTGPGPTLVVACGLIVADD